LLFPLIVLLLFVILDVGILLIRRAALDDAVRQGATEASVGVPAATAAAYTAEHSLGLLDGAGVVVCAPDADHVRVSAEWSWRWLSGPLVARLGGGAIANVTLRPSADRRIEVEAGATVTPEPLPPCE
jgi:hypothetical protein